MQLPADTTQKGQQACTALRPKTAYGVNCKNGKGTFGANVYTSQLMNFVLRTSEFLRSLRTT